MPFPPNYMDAVSKLAEACSIYEEISGTVAVLVGGAATALHTGGAFPSADFDIVAASDEAFATAMDRGGYVRDIASGHGLGGWYHPEFPEYGVEQVSGGYFDGRADRERCLKLVTRGGAIVLPPIEDMIADRLGQHAISQGDDSMLEQAKLLFRMAKDLDATYLRRRIVDEGGNPALVGL